MAVNPFIDRDDILAKIRAAFTARDAQYPARRAELKKRLAPLAANLEHLQASGHPMNCVDQIRLEVQWLLNYRDEWDRAARRIDDLEKSLTDPGQPAATQGEDGSWGGCCTEWYRKLEPTVDALQGDLPSAGLKKLLFMQPLSVPAYVLDYLYRLQISDIANTGINNRDELGAVQSALSQLIFKDQLRDLLADNDLGFSVTPELEATYVDYLAQTQHPRTGYWGPWYRFDDRLVPVQDLSMTFHVIQYRSGNIANWPTVIDSTLLIKNLVYPAGWQPDAQTRYSNHNNYDVLSIFHYGWPHMSSEQKKSTRTEIAGMLAWCLTSGLPDPAAAAAGPSMLDTYYFAVRFLDRAGLWDTAKRFWLHKKPALPTGSPAPHDLALRLQAGFAKLRDNSEEADTVRELLRIAACVSAPIGHSVEASD